MFSLMIRPWMLSRRWIQTQTPVYEAALGILQAHKQHKQTEMASVLAALQTARQRTPTTQYDASM
jgi:uncharacterized protein (DUF1810 family)